MHNKSARGETARRIYAVLKRNPDITSTEINGHLPDLSRSAVGCALHKMQKNGAVETRGRKTIRHTDGVGPKTAPTYHVKYKSGAILKPKAQPKAQPKPKVEAAAPKVEKPEDPIKLMAQTINGLRETNHTLSTVLLSTVRQLSESETLLAQERQRRNWWDKVKGWFA